MASAASGWKTALTVLSNPTARVGSALGGSGGPRWSPASWARAPGLGRRSNGPSRNRAPKRRVLLGLRAYDPRPASVPKGAVLGGDTHARLGAYLPDPGLSGWLPWLFRSGRPGGKYRQNPVSRFCHLACGKRILRRTTRATACLAKKQTSRSQHTSTCLEHVVCS